MATTIYALSSGRPPAGIAVVRVSGPRAFEALVAIAGEPLPPPRMMTLRTLVDPGHGIAIDQALVVAFAGPASATGDNLVEFHLHGGVAVVAAMLRALAGLGLTLAEPGAFTRRAFDNGRLDLAQVEGLGDLIDATTEAARRQALEQVGGRLGIAVERWRTMLIDLLADVEARLDFAEAEDDVAVNLSSSAMILIERLRSEIKAAIDDAPRGERLRDGLVVAVTGPPNVGKSSLVNRLARRDAAIVSSFAGTTRDAIEVHLDLDGIAVTLIDTAGLREAADPVEQEGIRRGRERARNADLVLSVGTPEAIGDSLVVNKVDLSGGATGWRDGRLHLSAQTGDGVAELRGWLSAWAAATVRPSEPVLVTHERQRLALVAAEDELCGAVAENDLVLVAERLRRAVHALRSVVGFVGVDDILGAIFSRFCIGK